VRTDLQNRAKVGSKRGKSAAKAWDEGAEGDGHQAWLWYRGQRKPTLSVAAKSAAYSQGAHTHVIKESIKAEAKIRKLRSKATSCAWLPSAEILPTLILEALNEPGGGTVFTWQRLQEENDESHHW
jgi:hypothetical protein